MPDQPRALMLFAAGLGTRMGALTRTRPKPLLEVAGRAMIDHALDIAELAGVPRIVVNTHYKAALLESHLDGRNLTISHEHELLDTGGGLRAALPLLGPGPVFTMNSDVLWTGPNPLATLRDDWRAESGALLLLVPARRARGYRGSGDFSLSPDGRLTRGGDLVYTGAQILWPDGLADFPQAAFSLNHLWDVMERRGTLRGVVHPGGWCDAGHPDGLIEAEAMLRGQE
jgi:N-acetyl-alpha-D-muramate 1-phosphate uridylyltransferase